MKYRWKSVKAKFHIWGHWEGRLLGNLKG